MTLDEFAEQDGAEDVAAQLERAKLDARESRARAKRATEDLTRALRLREEEFRLSAAPLEPPAWLAETSHPGKRSPHVPLLFFSDAQWGEVISADNMDGVNEFNVDVARRRYRTLVERAVDISLDHLPKNTYDGMVYLRGGDMVSGDIHQELRETNELSAVPAVRSLVEEEVSGIEALKRAFGRVHVVTVPGNHGRTTLKPPTKRVQDNYDTLSAWWLESHFRSDAAITWQTPASTDAVFDLHGRLYLATHGDNIGSRGGQGFIGPAATILRGMKKTMDEYARRGVALYKMFVGHFHTSYNLGCGWSNGSLPGYSEFARANRMTPEPPVQWLIFFHPRHGATSQWEVKVEPEPKAKEAAAPLFSGPA